MALEDRHPDAERLSEYADGLLGPADRVDVERHLAACGDCRAAVGETMVFVEAEERAFETRGPIAPLRGRRSLIVVGGALAAAAVLVMAIGFAKPEWATGFFGPRNERPELQELIVALDKEQTRPVEGRLAGGFRYAPAPPVFRGESQRAVSPDVSAAVAKLDQAAASREPGRLAAAGVGALVLGNVDDAVERLRTAAQREPTRASTFVDLSAAYMARSAKQGERNDLELARQAADRALTLEPQRLDAQFNRALALSRLGRIDEAGSAWRQYVAQETNPDWRSEAARHEGELRAAPERRP